MPATMTGAVAAQSSKYSGWSDMTPARTVDGVGGRSAPVGGDAAGYSEYPCEYSEYPCEYSEYTTEWADGVPRWAATRVLSRAQQGPRPQQGPAPPRWERIRHAAGG